MQNIQINDNENQKSGKKALKQRKDAVEKVGREHEGNMKNENATNKQEQNHVADCGGVYRWNTEIGWMMAVFEGDALVALDVLGDTPSSEETGVGAGETGRKTYGVLIEQTKAWMDAYLSGMAPSPNSIKIKLMGTSFQKMVWEELLNIPYGESITYGDLAKKIAHKMNVPRMSAQAIGGAVGKNPISILVPCHRVVGVSDKLTGYGGGLPLKAKLLDLEGIPYRW